MHISKTLPLLLAAVLLLAGTAQAHKVNLFAYAQDGTVYVEGYFSDGTPVSDAQVQVLDSTGGKQVQGQTDAQGLFDASIPVVDDLTIVLHAGMGHRASFLLEKSRVEAGQ